MPSHSNKGRRQLKICGVYRHGVRGARAYNWGQEAERPTNPSPVKTRRICINFRSDLQQNWGGHVDPSSPGVDATVWTDVTRELLIHCSLTVGSLHAE